LAEERLNFRFNVKAVAHVLLGRSDSRHRTV
jgi:hypothetical protein